MKPDPKIIDDLARMAGGAVNILSGVQQQIREEIRSRVEDMMARADVVPREDFERLEAMVAKLRQRQEELEARLDAVNGAPKKTADKQVKKAVKKTTAKAPPKKSAPKQSAKKPAKAKKKV